MGKSPLALVAVALAVALGVLVIWRAQSGASARPQRARGSAAAATRADDGGPASASRIGTAAESLAYSTHDASAGSDSPPEQEFPLRRTETFSLDGAVWIPGTVRLPPNAPSDDTLEVWAIGSSGDCGLPGDDNDVPDLVRAGRPATCWWSRRAVHADGSFRLPVPADGGYANFVLNSRWLYLGSQVQVSVTRNTGELILEPALGTWIVGRCVTPPGVAPEDTPAGALTHVVAESSALTISRFTCVRPDRSFELRGVPSCEPAVLVVEPKRLCSAFRSGLTLEPGARVDIEIELLAGARISGTVVDDAGAPLAKARVRVRGQQQSWMWYSPREEHLIETSAVGTFQVLGLPKGRTHIEAFHEGCLEGKAVDVELTDGERRDGIVLVLPRGDRVAGRVTWPDGSPAARAFVQVIEFTASFSDGSGRRRKTRFGASQPAMTDPHGKFEVIGLGPGPYRITARGMRRLHAVPGEAMKSEFLWATPESVPGAASGLELVLEPGVELHGRVVDDQDEPVRKFSTSEGGPFETEDGSFRLMGLEPGRRGVSASADGYVMPGNPEPFDIPNPGDPVVIRMVRAATVAGTVLDSAERPASGVRVGACRGGWFGAIAWMTGILSVDTDENGAFRFDNVHPGSLTIKGLTGDSPASDSVETWLAAGEHREGLVLHLRAGGRVTGEVFDGLGARASGWMVEADSPFQGGSPEIMTDDGGRFAFEQLPAGTYEVLARAPPGEGAPTPEGGRLFQRRTRASVRDGATTHVVLSTPPTSPVRVFGRVTRGGRAVESGTVCAAGAGMMTIHLLRSVRVGPAGEYAIVLDGPGDAILVWRPDDYGGSATFFVRVARTREQRIDLALPRSAIRGIVTDPDGRPLEGARVELIPPDHRRSPVSVRETYRVESDPAGRFEFTDLEPGRYALATGGDDSQAAEDCARLVSGGIELDGERVHDGIEMRLSRTGRITGTVLGPDGEPHPGALVFVRDERGQILEPRLGFSVRTSDGLGRFVCDDVGPGRYTVSARTRSLAAPDTEPVVVREGEASSTQVVLERATILVMSLERADGREVLPIFSVRDQFDRDVGSLKSMVRVQSLITDGIFSPTQRFGPFPPGRYRVRAETASGESVVDEVTLDGQPEERVLFRLEDR